MKSATSGSIMLEPAKSEITIRELLNHISGITYGDGRHDRWASRPLPKTSKKRI